MKLYHVVKNYNGGDLESLYEQHGSEAYDIFAEKWPEAGALGHYHAHYIHLHSTKEDAEAFAAEFGGEILEIKADDLEVEIDGLEYKHPMVKDCIDAEYVKRVG